MIPRKSRSILSIAILCFTSIIASGQLYPTGGYQGGGYGSGGDVVVVDLKVILQGAYRAGAMSTDLNDLGLLPLVQPFDSVPFYWHYTGKETVDSIPDGDVVDWIEVELRETTGGASTATGDSVIGRRAGFLMKDGTITDLDGTSELRFKYVLSTHNLYAVIKHRNHLGIMNAAPLTMVSEIHSCNFTTAQSQAYQDPAIITNSAMADLGAGKYGLWSGNAYPDLTVKYNGLNNDREEILIKTGTDTPSNTIQTYHRTDVNMDSRVKYMGISNDKVHIYNVLGGNAANILQSHVP
jgi:hypothetical protein